MSVLDNYVTDVHDSSKHNGYEHFAIFGHGEEIIAIQNCSAKELAQMVAGVMINDSDIAIAVKMAVEAYDEMMKGEMK